MRWVAVLVVGFLLLVVGYYLYFDVLNRAPAEVYVAQRGTAIAAVYGTVTINPVGSAAALRPRTPVTCTPRPGLDIITNANGVAVKDGQLLGTVVDEIGQRQLEQAQQAYDAAVAHQKAGPPSAGPLQSYQDSLAAMNKLPQGNVPQVQRDAARKRRHPVQSGRRERGPGVEPCGRRRQKRPSKLAQDQQSRTEIKAPFDGVLTFVGFGNNAYVLPNQSVYNRRHAGHQRHRPSQRGGRGPA